MSTSTLFKFPNPVNEVSARLVACFVAIAAVVIIVFQLPVLLIPMAYGFIARAATGPTLSPLGQLVTRVITPLLPVKPRPVAGPPKRFAQTVGAVFSTLAILFYFAFHLTLAAYVMTGFIVIAATLESFFAFCIGCRVFNVLMRAGLIPQEVCERCSNLQLQRT
jgi:hypothetical protein